MRKGLFPSRPGNPQMSGLHLRAQTCIQSFNWKSLSCKYIVANSWCKSKNCRWASHRNRLKCTVPTGVTPRLLRRFCVDLCMIPCLRDNNFPVFYTSVHIAMVRTTVWCVFAVWIAIPSEPIAPSTGFLQCNSRICCPVTSTLRHEAMQNEMCTHSLPQKPIKDSANLPTKDKRQSSH